MAMTEQQLTVAVANARRWAEEEPGRRTYYLRMADALEAEGAPAKAAAAKPEKAPAKVKEPKPEPAPKQPEPPKEDISKAINDAVERLERKVDEIVQALTNKAEPAAPPSELGEIKDSIQELAKAMTAPKRILRDAEGRPVGIAPVGAEK